ncbi:MFS transporter [Kordiimonas sp. SCSIO 12610]|uniref:spinster family MFS transporter n=1 Tax=Kordiimonas sp. SCSIO 12610 TaxID=2829597 RepID=UPI00210B4E54|nr:MFS transporter [Kordiimonas sp. SCSIO 12610]UTW54716.1 MFS transporter [Kordiimonas sp. SCSIO 12610]
MQNLTDTESSPSEAPWYILAILILVYTFNFIDRQIIGILAVPIKEELALNDGELGAMGGIAFALFYTILGVPVAMLADRKSRTWIMTIALGLWSLMTALCGLAQNFWQLFMARLGVGVGEAGGVAPAYSLIADFYPPEKRARALAVYSFGIPIGSALGIVFGGVIASYIDWRAAFFIVGIAGLVLTPIFRLTVKEPKRGQFDPKTNITEPAPITDVFSILLPKPSFWLISFGASCSSMMGYGIFFWLPSFLVRSYGLSVLDASLFYGAILLVGGIIGIWIGGVYGDKFGQNNKSAYAIVPAIAFLVTIPFYFFGVLTDTLTIAAMLLIIPTALGLVWLGPVISAVQHLVEPGMRSTASAIFLFINNLIGIGLGTYLIGKLSEYFTAEYGDDSLRYAILAGTGFYLFAALFFFMAARYLKKDWEA